MIIGKFHSYATTYGFQFGGTPPPNGYIYDPKTKKLVPTQKSQPKVANTSPPPPPAKLQSRFTPDMLNRNPPVNSGAVAAGGRAGLGVTAGASVNATVSNLQTKANQTISDIIPDSIEDNLPENFPLWILPATLVGGLVLILLLRK